MTQYTSQYPTGVIKFCNCLDLDKVSFLTDQDGSSLENMCILMTRA